MKLSTLVLATTMIVAPALAFAQSQPAPANQSGPSVNPTTQQPTDQGAGNETGNTKASPSRGAMGHGSAMDSGKSGTTGAASDGMKAGNDSDTPRPKDGAKGK